jgi:hypothetical protein
MYNNAITKVFAVSSQLLKLDHAQIPYQGEEACA